MTRVDSDKWVSKAMMRKVYRDHHRNKFFREVGLEKGSHIQNITGAPEQQRHFLQELLELTVKGSLPDGEHKSHIATVSAILSTAGLGIGEMGKVATNRENLDHYTIDALRKTWFWSPAFFD